MYCSLQQQKVHSFQVHKEHSHILSQKEIINTLQSTNIIQYVFLDYKTKKPELNAIKITRNTTYVSKLRTMLLINPNQRINQVKMRKYLEPNNKENSTHQGDPQKETEVLNEYGGEK